MGEKKVSKPGKYYPSVVVKFHDDVKLPYKDGVEEDIQKSNLGPWAQLIREFPGIKLKKSLRSLSPDKIDALVKQAAEYDQTYRPRNLLTYFTVECPPGVDPVALANALSSWPAVELAYVEGDPTTPPVDHPENNPRFSNQGYLTPAPVGIDALYAWGFPGGDGAGIQFVDVEQGWVLNHEDLVDAHITVISGQNLYYKGHGTAVLGIVVAVNNDIGGVGIVPHASARVVSIWNSPTSANIPDAILSAINALNPGDVLLLEVQVQDTASGQSVPVEAFDLMYNVIRTGTALGRVIVECAGNAVPPNVGFDLGTYINHSSRRIFDPDSPDFRDSGAIMVAAATSAYPHRRKDDSNYGRRIDCYAWGENIDTAGEGFLGDDPHSYTTNFGGTSGAGAIVAGAAVAIQGIAQTRPGGQRLSPKRLRSFLNNPLMGTESDRLDGSAIGVMPNLKAVIDAVMGMAPV